MKNKSVIFDMDGVIVDTEPIYRGLNCKIYNDLGIKITKEQQYSYAGMIPKDKWTLLKEKFNLKQAIEELTTNSSSAKYDYLSNDKNEVPLITGVDKLICKLKSDGFTIAVASSSPKRNVETVLKRTNLIEYFDYIVSGTEVKKGKPDPEIFLKAADCLNAKVQDCTVIEDSGNGVKAAKNAKMKCVGFKNPHSGNQDISKADIVIDEFSKESIKKIIEIALK